MRKKHGVGLGTVLVVVALVVTLGFALAGASVQHLNVQSRLTNSARALDVARAAVNLGLERVLTNQDYGKDSGTDTLQEFKDSQGAVGRITFNPIQADKLGIPVSLNNLQGTEVKSGSTGQVVPLKTVHLVGVGTFRNVTRKVEVMLSLPPYPYAAASDGPINARQVVVGAVPPGTALGMPPAKLKPANLLSNAEGGQALTLGEGSTVTGDLMAKGGIKVDQSAQVKGLVRPNQEERELPIWKTDDYDPKLLGRPYLELQESYSASPSGTGRKPGESTTSLSQEPSNRASSNGAAVKFTGTVRRQGNLNIEGDLDVEGALLFVDGNLNVNGALTGKGVVVANGDLTIRDHAEVDAQDKVALLAKKKLTLKGEGRASSLITGILYSEGGFEASQLTLRGVVISREGASGTKAVTLNGTRLVKEPEAVTVTVAPTTQSATFSVLLGVVPTSAGGGFLIEPISEDARLKFDQSQGFETGPQMEQVVDGSGESTTISWVSSGQEGLVATFTAIADPNDADHPFYAVSFNDSRLVIPGFYKKDAMIQKLAEVTRMDVSMLGAIFDQYSTAPSAQPTTIAPSYTMTVKEPSQLLPFYQQARVTYWKED